LVLWLANGADASAVASISLFAYWLCLLADNCLTYIPWETHMHGVHLISMWESPQPLFTQLISHFTKHVSNTSGYTSVLVMFILMLILILQFVFRHNFTNFKHHDIMHVMKLIHCNPFLNMLRAYFKHYDAVGHPSQILNQSFC